MTTEQVHTVLRRKAEAGRPAPEVAPQTPDRAIAQVLAKLAQDRFALALRVSAARESRMTLADLPELLPELSLLAVIEGPGEGLGLVALPPDTLSALIEAQTMGQLAKTAPAPRRPTRIDAAMAADFVDAMLIGIEGSLAGTEAAVWAGGFRYASYLDDPRPLGLMLEDLSYRVWQIELELGPGGARTGHLIWAVPAQGRGTRGVAPGSAGAASDAGAGPEGAGVEAARAAQDWHAAMERSVLASQATLDAVLHRVTLPLSAVLGLKVGMDIPIPSDSLERLTLEAGERRRISMARLGQHRGFRAVRLIEEDSDEAEMSEPPAPRAKPKKLAEFSAGESPFGTVAAAPVSIGRMGDPSSALYDPPQGAAPMDLGGLGGLGDLGGGDLGGLGGLGSGELPPLDGFGGLGPDDELPPLKIAGL